MIIKKYSLEITVLSFIALTLLLIVLGTYAFFFNVKDYTLIAGIIAFFGAIIGGFITLVGVRLTINENHKINYKNRIPEKVINAEQICQNYKEMLRLYYVGESQTLRFKPHQLRMKVKKIIKESDSESKVLLVSPRAYGDLKIVKNTIDIYTDAYYQKIQNDDHELTKEEVEEYTVKLAKHCHKLIYTALWNLEEEQKEYLAQYH